MEENQKKVALVTGASSGIGRAIGARLLALGYEVYGIGRQFPAELPKASVNATDLSAGTRPQAPLAPETDAAAATSAISWIRRSCRVSWRHFRRSGSRRRGR